MKTRGTQVSSQTLKITWVSSYIVCFAKKW
jgi:hypothetical protein